MRARRPRRSGYRPALEVLPQRRPPSGGLSLGEGPPSGATGSGVVETVAVVQPLTAAEALDPDDPAPLG